jgi:hypothetical protein
VDKGLHSVEYLFNCSTEVGKEKKLTRSNGVERASRKNFGRYYFAVILV